MNPSEGLDGDDLSEKGAARSAGWRPVPASPRSQTNVAFKTKARSWYHHYITELVLRRKSLPPSKDGRRIPLRLGHDMPLVDERRGHPYVSNAIRTSRYTVYDFLPKQLLFQFSRLANFYFLCVGVPQTIPGLSTTGSYTTILPLLFFVLLTIVKEGYDDWKRHRLDKVENARTAVALRKTSSPAPQAGPIKAGKWFWFGSAKEVDNRSVYAEEEPNETGFQWTATGWKDLRVGDIVRLSRDEDVPADIVLLHANGENDLAYIETMALDGETNLKSKQVSTALEGCGSIEGIKAVARRGAELVVEDPNPDLYRFDGRVSVEGKILPLTLAEVVYRGCTLRNTPCAIGVVINTGEECKIRRNANRHPNAKKPALESIANRIVITLAIYVVLLSVGCSMGYIIWRKSTEQYSWYLTDASVEFQEIIIGFAIQFNNVIPLALYISLEIVKIGQMIFLNSDIEMYDEVSDTPARCNTNTILENLGQIGYIFSDKTGTLTENVMKFRKMSIAGTAWLHDMDVDATESTVSVDAQVEGKVRGKEQGVLSTAAGRHSLGDSIRTPTIVTPASPSSLSPGLARQSSSRWRSTGRPDLAQPDLNTRDLLEYIRLKPNSPFGKRAIQYLLAIAICHTCLPEMKDGKQQFQAASPDELALVEAAMELGFVVVQRSSRAVTLRIMDGDNSEERVYEILDVIEFSSKRKRMSVIVRCPDGRIWLVSKGADSTILPRLRMANLALRKVTEIRKSAEMEQELRRRSDAREPRNSFGGRPSLTLRRSSGLHPNTAGPSRGTSQKRSKSFETSRLRRSEDYLRNSLTIRTTSLDVPHERPSRFSAYLGGGMPEKFAFLEDPSVCDDSQIFTRCFKHLDEFATEGLRTLLFAHKYIPELDYLLWKKVFDDATTSLVDRQERIDDAGDLIEQSLELIGASAIEDKLQKGVPETIDRLRRANIKIWMLTGDKRETAINIAHSARVCLPESDTFILDATKGDLEAQLVDVMEDMQLVPCPGQRPAHTVVVIDGHTLAAIDQPGAVRMQSLFYTLIPIVDSVICCRASPAQKALLVRAIRKTSSKGPAQSRWSRLRPSWRATSPLTLAIGDGANDLAMLAEAHVGVGVSGREGLQAARVADYSVAQFRFLSRLLLVHGRWNYGRTARFVLATFWKEMFFYLPTALYQRSNGYTGTSLYENWSLTVLNTLFTSLCVVAPGIWEQDLAAETLLAVPELYVFGQRDQGLNLAKYAGWMAAAVAEGVFVWFACWAGYGFLGQVRDEGLFALGDLVFSVAIMWTNLKLL